MLNLLLREVVFVLEKLSHVKLELRKLSILDIESHILSLILLHDFPEDLSIHHKLLLLILDKLC